MRSLLSMAELLLACGAIMLASLSGKLLVWRGAGPFIERNLHLMVSFAAGVFVIFAWQLSEEVLEHMGPLSGLAWIAGGAIMVTLVCKFLPHTHGPSSKDHSHAHSHLDAHRMLVSDSVHNAGDGILLAATFAMGPVVGFGAAISVLVHEVVQEISEFFVLRDAGYSIRRALLLNFATSTTILIGAVGGYFLLELFEALEGPILAIATGGILSVIFYDLLPHSLQDARSRSVFWQHLLWLLLGMLLMYGVVNLVPHQDPEHAEELSSHQVLNLS